MPQRECVPSISPADMAPQALHDAVAVLERPLTHLGIIKQTSPFSSFYSLTGVDIDGEPIDFGAYRDKARRGRVGLGFGSGARARSLAR